MRRWTTGAKREVNHAQVLDLDALGQPGSAQSSNCAERSIVLKRLSEVYGETRQSIGLGADSTVVEVFASAATGTWSIIVTLPTGTSCIVAAGDSFEITENRL